MAQRHFSAPRLVEEWGDLPRLNDFDSFSHQ